MAHEGILAVVRRCVRGAFLVAGPSLLLVALGFSIETGLFLHRSVAADGRIVALAPVTVDLAPIGAAQDNSTAYAPVFSFSAADGKSYTVRSMASSNPVKVRVGDKVRVLYETNRPAGARLADFVQLWIFPVAFGSVGALATGTGCLLLLYERRRGRLVTV